MSRNWPSTPRIATANSEAAGPRRRKPGASRSTRSAATNCWSGNCAPSSARMRRNPSSLGAAGKGRWLRRPRRRICATDSGRCARIPGFTAVAMLALALGIGANTAIFSVVNGVLLRPLAYPDPGRLMRISETTSEFSQMSVAYPNYLDWRRESRSFTDMGASRSDDFNFTGAGEPEHLSGEYVSASLFPVLGVTPVLGRSFLPQEDRQGAACAVMLSYGFWKQRLGSRPEHPRQGPDAQRHELRRGRRPARRFPVPRERAGLRSDRAI